MGNNNRFFQLADISPKIDLNLNLLSSITNQQSSQATASSHGSIIRICFPKPPTETTTKPPNYSTPKPPGKRCYKKVCKKFKEVVDYKCVDCSDESYEMVEQPGYTSTAYTN